MNYPITPQKTWWQRNWKWAVPGCGCLGIIVLIIGGLAFGAFTFFDKIGEASGGDDAITHVASNPEAQKYLGTPIESDGYGSRSINWQNGRKTAEATLPIKGPKSDGIIEVKSITYGDTTIYKVLTLQVKEPPRVIDILEENKVEVDSLGWD